MSSQRMGLGFSAKLAAFCMALALCMAWLFGSSCMVYAEDGTIDHATLTIIASTKGAGSSEFDADGADVWVNKEYAVKEGDTIESLLKAAIAEGDLEAIDASDGWLQSITSAKGVLLDSSGSIIIDGDTAYLYWNVFEDGESSYTGIGASISAGGRYQLVWLASVFDMSTGDTMYVTGAPSTPGAWASWYAANSPEDDLSQDDPDPDPLPRDESASAVSVNGMRDLMLSIAGSFNGTADPWQAMDLAALGMAVDVDKPSLLATALDEVKAGANPVKHIIALTALGYDCTALPDGNGSYDMIDSALEPYANSGHDVYTLINSLWALASGGYDFKYASDEIGMQASDLVDALVGAQLSDGAFYASNDSDTTAMAINALQPYAAGSAVAKDALDKALVALKGMQLADGGWQSSYGMPNSASTAFAIIAMAAAGINPATEWISASGRTPIDALLSYAVKTDDGYGFKWLADDDEPDPVMTEEAFRALVAYRGLAATASKSYGYNIYVDAKEGIARIPGLDGMNEKIQENLPPKTADSHDALMLLLFMFAAAGVATARATRRKIEG